MASIRQRVRQSKWVRVNITCDERKKNNITHIDLSKWIEANRTGKVESTMVKDPGNNPMSAFAFENASDASMFVLRWK